MIIVEFAEITLKNRIEDSIQRIGGNSSKEYVDKFFGDDITIFDKSSINSVRS